MCQRGVERVIGRLVTDEGFRRRFGEDPHGMLQEMTTWGVELTAGEIHTLETIDARRLSRCSSAIDSRLLKTEVRRTSS